jgi:hypothetical protein
VLACVKEASMPTLKHVLVPVVVTAELVGLSVPAGAARAAGPFEIEESVAREG